MNSDYRNTDTTRTDLRTTEDHYSAAEVYRALGCPYPGTGTYHRQDSPRDDDELITNSGDTDESVINDGEVTPAYLNKDKYTERRGGAP